MVSARLATPARPTASATATTVRARATSPRRSTRARTLPRTPATVLDRASSATSRDSGTAEHDHHLVAAARLAARSTMERDGGVRIVAVGPTVVRILRNLPGVKEHRDVLTG